MHHHPTVVSSLILRGLINLLKMNDVDELVHKQFPEIDRHARWESYNIVLLALAAVYIMQPRGVSVTAICWT